MSSIIAAVLIYFRLHRDRLNELNNKCTEYEKKYQRIVEENKKLVSEIGRVRK